MVTSFPLRPAGGSTTVSSQYSRTGTHSVAWCYLSSQLVPEVLGVPGYPLVPPPRSNLRHTQEPSNQSSDMVSTYTHTHDVRTRHSCSLFTHGSRDSDVSHGAFLSRWTYWSICTLSAATTGRFIYQPGQPCKSELVFISLCLCMDVLTTEPGGPGSPRQPGGPASPATPLFPMSPLKPGPGGPGGPRLPGGPEEDRGIHQSSSDRTN